MLIGGLSVPIRMTGSLRGESILEEHTTNYGERYKIHPPWPNPVVSFVIKYTQYSVHTRLHMKSMFQSYIYLWIILQ